MTIDQLAEQMFDVAALAQSDRMLTDRERKNGAMPHPRKVSPEFNKLHEVAKNHYRVMAQWVLVELWRNNK